MHFESYDALFKQLAVESAKAERDGVRVDDFVTAFMSSHIKHTLDEIAYMKAMMDEGGEQMTPSQLYRVDVSEIKDKAQKFMKDFKNPTFTAYNKPIEEIKELHRNFQTYTELLLFTHILAASVRAKSKGE